MIKQDDRQKCIAQFDPSVLLIYFYSDWFCWMADRAIANLVHNWPIEVAITRTKTETAHKHFNRTFGCRSISSIERIVDASFARNQTQKYQALARFYGNLQLCN